MLLGKHTLPLTTDGTFALPVEYLPIFSIYGGILTCGLDHNLLLLSKPAFEKLYAGLTATSLTDPLARDLRRLLLGNAVDLPAGGAPVQMPENLRSFASLQGEVVLVGQGEYLEIWSASAWAERAQALELTARRQQGFEKFNVSLA